MSNVFGKDNTSMQRNRIESLLASFSGLLSIVEEDENSPRSKSDGDSSNDRDVHGGVDGRFIAPSFLLFCRVLDEQFLILQDAMESDLEKYREILNNRTELLGDNIAIYEQIEKDVSRYYEQVGLIAATNCDFEQLFETILLKLGLISDADINSSHQQDEDECEI